MNNIYSENHNNHLRMWKMEMDIFNSLGTANVIYFNRKARIQSLKEAIEIYVPDDHIRFKIQGGFEAFVSLTEKKSFEIAKLAEEIHEILQKCFEDRFTVKGDNQYEFLSPKFKIYDKKTELAHVITLDTPLPDEEISFTCDNGIKIKDVKSFKKYIDSI